MTQNQKPKKKNKRHYFTQVHEDAIVRYARIDDIKERTVLYVNFIHCLNSFSCKERHKTLLRINMNYFIDFRFSL